jgi:hypothetical protein
MKSFRVRTRNSHKSIDHKKTFGSSDQSRPLCRLLSKLLLIFHATLILATFGFVLLHFCSFDLWLIPSWESRWNNKTNTKTVLKCLSRRYRNENKSSHESLWNSRDSQLISNWNEKTWEWLVGRGMAFWYIIVTLKQRVLRLGSWFVERRFWWEIEWRFYVDSELSLVELCKRLGKIERIDFTTLLL